MRRPSNAFAVAATVLATAVALVAAPTTAAASGGSTGHRSDRHGTTYVNPVSRSFADTFADPSVIRGKDGYWYAYGTSDPLREGEGRRHLLPIARSSDLVHWAYVGDAFTEATLPTWADRANDPSLWAPDIRYVDGEYRLYYVVTQTTVTPDRDDNAIGMATAPTPTGPWTDSGAPVAGPRCVAPGNCKWTFDPSAVTDTDGSQWLFYGSYYGGVYVVRLTPDGRHTVGEATQVAIDNKFEGAYAVHRGGWWYLMMSTANCCAGPTTGYSVQVGRSRAITGPYVDKQGTPLLQSRAGGTPMLTQNGNRWIGAGHNAVATDLAGQDWVVYHAIDRNDPYLDGTDGINERPMLIDRLDWVDGWPTTRAGLGPSEGPQPGPATKDRTFTRFDGGIPHTYARTGAWTTATDAQSGRHARSGSAGALLTRAATPGDRRVEADLRSTGAAFGLVTGWQQQGTGVRAVVDPAAHLLRLEQRRHGAVVATATAPLPAAYTADEWHSLWLEVRGRRAHAQLTHARLQDPVADLTLTLADTVHSGRSGAVAAGPGVDVDNLSALRAAHLVTREVPLPRTGTLDPAASDEFDGTLKPDWTWVRGPQGAVAGGELRWPVEKADLVGSGNDASVLLRNAPAGNWTIETKLTIDLGTDTIRNYQQGGLIAYVNDDLFTRFSHVAIWNTRQTEFGKEMPYAGRLSYGGTIVGPPADTTWLRIVHRVDPNNGEHELRALSSRDGHSWVKGGVWTLPAGSTVRVGLVSHGWNGTDPRATSNFDYFRLFRD